MKLLHVEKLRTYFFTHYGVVKAVDDVNLSLTKGEILGVAGESGSGKSTLASSIIRMVQPPGRIVDGKIFFENFDITSMSESELNEKIRWKKISMVFQGAMNALNPVYTIGYQLIEPLIYGKGMSKSCALEIAKKYLNLVGLESNLVKRYPHELSGGMQQRVLIAMALILEPPLLIADEPTTALDVIVQAQIFNLLKDLQDKLGLSLILITHDLGVVAELAHKVAIMYAGKIVEAGPSDLVYSNPLHPYTRGLLASVLRLHKPREKPKFIPGNPPDLRKPPSGCRFHPRCLEAKGLCREVEPQLIEAETNHYVSCHNIKR
jgi:peptide/nickel transport system ATP-binding protein